MSEYINKEQAIDLIESMIADKGVAFNQHKLAMALKDMESAEIPEAKDTDLISRQAAIQAVANQHCLRDMKAIAETYNKNIHSVTTEFEEMLLDIANEIESLPSAEPKPACEDAISRQDAIEALEHINIPTQAQREYAIEIFEDIPQVEPPKKVVAQIKVDTDEIMERIKEEYKIKEQPVCEDAISRADTIQAMCQECKVFPDDEVNCADCTEVAIVKGMPPVEPKRPKGEWIVYSLVDEGRVELECPECGDTFVRAVDYRPHFCENCGADMRGEEDD